MIHAQKAKWLMLTPPAAKVDNASVTVAELDTAGWDYLELLVAIGDLDIALSALKLTESDATGSGHVDISGTVIGTDANIAGTTSSLPAADDDNKMWLFQLDLRKRKRFIDAVITVGDGTTGAYVVVFARLSRGEIAPLTAAQAGVEEILRV